MTDGRFEETRTALPAAGLVRKQSLVAGTKCGIWISRPALMVFPSQIAALRGPWRSARRLSGREAAEDRCACRDAPCAAF
jgi:hypothetical protein